MGYSEEVLQICRLVQFPQYSRARCALLPSSKPGNDARMTDIDVAVSRQSNLIGKYGGVRNTDDRVLESGMLSSSALEFGDAINH